MTPSRDYSTIQDPDSAGRLTKIHECNRRLVDNTEYL